MSNGTVKTAALRTYLPRARLEDPKIHGRVPLGHDDVDFCLQGGLRRGRLHEIFAGGGHETASMGFAAAISFRVAAGGHVLWIGQDFSAVEFGELAATGLLELGLDPARFLLLRLAEAVDVLRAGCDSLASGALGAVVVEVPGEPKILDLMASRRLTLASAQKGIAVFLLRFLAKPRASTAETRWHVRAVRSSGRRENWGYPAFETELVRNRHGRTGRWVMEWDCDDGLFRNPCGQIAEDFGAVVPPPSDRSVASAMEGVGGAETARRIA